MSKRLEMAEKTANACYASIADCFPVELFKALGDGNRIAILAALAQGCQPQTVSQIAAPLAIDLSVVSRHLRQLREAGVVESSKEGREVFYMVRYSELVAILRQMADAMEACCVPDERETNSGDQDVE